MKERLANLIDLKSIVTVLLIVTLVTVVVANINIEDEAIKTLFTSVVSSVIVYYFTKQNKPNDNSTQLDKDKGGVV